MSQHTPGPWAFGTLSETVMTRDGRLIADLSDRWDDVAADGRLISSAPDLLDVAEAIITAIAGQMLVLPTHVEKHLLDGARAAVHKATTREG